MDIFIGEQFTALYEGFQNAEIYFLIRPFALPEKGGAFILFGENINFSLTFFFGIVAPPAAERGKLHRAFAGKQQLPEILLAGKVVITFTLVPLMGYWGVIVSEPIVWVLMVIPLIVQLIKNPAFARGKNNGG